MYYLLFDKSSGSVEIINYKPFSEYYVCITDTNGHEIVGNELTYMEQIIIIGSYKNIEYVQGKTAELHFINAGTREIHRLHGNALRHEKIIKLLSAEIQLHCHKIGGLNKSEVCIRINDYLHRKISHVIHFLMRLDPNLNDNSIDLSAIDNHLNEVTKIPDYDIENIIINNIRSTQTLHYGEIMYYHTIYKCIAKFSVDNTTLHEFGENVGIDLNIGIEMTDGKYCYVVNSYVYKFNHTVYANEVSIADICKDKFKYEKEIRVIIELMLRLRGCIFKYIDRLYEDYVVELPMPTIKSARF